MAQEERNPTPIEPEPIGAASELSPMTLIHSEGGPRAGGEQSMAGQGMGTGPVSTLRLRLIATAAIVVIVLIVWLLLRSR